MKWRRQTRCIDLRDPATKPADLVKTVADLGALLERVNPTVRSELCTAAEALASSSPELLERAIQLVSKARDLDPGDDAMTKRLARLLAARLALRAAQPTRPAKTNLNHGSGLRADRSRRIEQCHCRLAVRRVLARPGFARSAIAHHLDRASKTGRWIHAIRAGPGMANTIAARFRKNR